jgi:hypothetical protein
MTSVFVWGAISLLNDQCVHMECHKSGHTFVYWTIITLHSFGCNNFIIVEEKIDICNGSLYIEENLTPLQYNMD